MAIYATLKAAVDSSLPTNITRDITAAIHRSLKYTEIDELGKLQTRGVVIPADNPGTLDGPAAFFASTPGTYTNYGGLVVAAGEVRYLIYDGDVGWTSDLITTASGPIAVQIASAGTYVIPADRLLEAITATVDTNQDITIAFDNSYPDMWTAESMLTTVAYTQRVDWDTVLVGALTLTVTASVDHVNLKIYLR